MFAARSDADRAAPITMQPDAPVDEGLLALMRNALGDAAQGCASELRAQGVQGVDDWSILETAGEQHCLDVLSAVATKHSLNAVQVARLRVALRGQGQRFAAPRCDAAPVKDGLRLPIGQAFRRFTLRNPLEIAFVFSNRPGWYRAVFDALDGYRLREAYFESCQIFMLVSALLLGGQLTLVTYDLGQDQERGPPLHVFCLTLNLCGFFAAFCSVLFQLYALHAYLPVHVDNLRDVLRATRMLPMTGGLYFAISAWCIFLGLVCEAMRPLEGLNFWLFRVRDLGWGWRIVPLLVMFACFLSVQIPFFIQISGVDRIIAHSGALGERQVLPNEAVAWSASTTKRSLAALALAEQNSDLEELYVRRRRAPPEAAWSPRARGARLVPKAR